MKDTNNILPYGIWSAGDYTGISTESNNIISNKWSNIGEYSITNNEQSWITLYQDTTLNNVSLELSAIINTETSGALCIYYRVNSSYQSVKSGFDKNIRGLISVSAQIPSNASLVWCRVDLVDNSKKTYVDNIVLTQT